MRGGKSYGRVFRRKRQNCSADLLKPTGSVSKEGPNAVESDLVVSGAGKAGGGGGALRRFLVDLGSGANYSLGSPCKKLLTIKGSSRKKGWPWIPGKRKIKQEPAPDG